MESAAGFKAKGAILLRRKDSSKNYVVLCFAFQDGFH